MSEMPAETSPVIVTNEEKPTLESPTKKTSSSALQVLHRNGNWPQPRGSI